MGELIFSILSKVHEHGGVHREVSVLDLFLFEQLHCLQSPTSDGLVHVLLFQLSYQLDRSIDPREDHIAAVSILADQTAVLGVVDEGELYLVCELVVLLEGRIISAHSDK